MTTHTLPKNAMAAAFEQALLADPVDTTLEQHVEQETESTPVTASFTEILSDPTPSVRFSVLQSFASSLNLSLIAQVRQTLREDVATRDDQADDTTSIDQRNEADDDAGINDRGYNDKSLEYMGNRAPMSASQIAKRLGAIRAFVLEQQALTHMSTVTPFVPRSLQESIDFLRSQMPVNSAVSDPAILVLAKVTGKTPEACVTLRNALMKVELEALDKIAPQLVATAEGLTHKANTDYEYIERCFDELPAPVKVNLYTSAINALATAYNSAFKKVMRGNATAAGDMTIAEAVQKRALVYLEQLMLKHATELGEYESRGLMLKEVKRIV